MMIQFSINKLIYIICSLVVVAVLGPCGGGRC